MMNTPILFLIFNRSDTTAQVFSAIREARPTKLYVAADGPRAGRQGEDEQCRITREIATAIDWECELHTLFREQNLGCKVAVSSAITWFFEQEEEGIILEDDCLPTESFFGFCEMMLERYRDDERVMMIAGTNFLLDGVRPENSCFFSNMVSIWGWATWRTSWQKRITDIGVINVEKIDARFNNRTYSRYITKMLRAATSGAIDTWDIQWCYSIMAQNGICVTPALNQVKNIGYVGTHTSGTSSPFFDMETENFDLSRLEYPVFFTISSEFDNIAMNNIITHNKIPANFVELVKNKIVKSIKF